MSLARRMWLALAAEAFVLGGLLLGAAGRLDWPAAWAFLALLFILSAPMSVWLLRRDPALLRERLSAPVQPGQPLWDRLVLIALLAGFVAWLVLIGLDAGRYRWSFMPDWLQGTGAALLIGAFWISWRVFRANTFLAPVVRIQVERAHKVVSTGPYAVVRHPLYAGALLFFAAVPLMLGSWWGLVGGGALAGLIVLRTALEDRILRQSLDGYADYAARVRYRLVPGLW